MAWSDRIREAAYTDPNGLRTVLPFKELTSSTEHRGTAFEFPNVDGAYVQKRGLGPRIIPMLVFFSGDDCDLEADAFEASLAVQDFGTLEHPRHGILKATPLGTVTRTDPMVEGANQVTLQIGFMETIESLFPLVEPDGGQVVRNDVETFNAAASEELDERVIIEAPSERFAFLESYKALLNNTVAVLQPLADGRDEVARDFNEIRDSIYNGIDVLIDDPLTLGFQTLQLIQAPALAAADIKAQLNAYQNLAESIYYGDGAVRTKGNGNTTANDFRAASLFASGATSAAALSSVNGSFKSKPEALAAANGVLELFDSVSSWRDDNHAALGLIDTGEAHTPLLKTVSRSAGQLVKISFNLAQERNITLVSPRTALDLAAELYGDVDDSLLFLMDTNDLSGAEILELPAGKRIVYYV
jgi:hypothetical protein